VGIDDRNVVLITEARPGTGGGPRDRLMSPISPSSG
jgi:hypothetical protein